MIHSFSMSSFVAGVMLGMLLAGAWFLGSESPLATVFSSSFFSPTATTTNTNPTQEESGAVSVTNQLAGDTVTVESVTVAPPGVWVAVREMIGTGLGNVLGAMRVNGPRSSISISLLRATVPNRRYAIQLYRDDGNGIFDVSTNSVYVDFATGAPVIAYFTTIE
ncbi:MAG: hypothetical protein Q8O94_00590 [bacterium]|nr:hypothetical protein [bacterium]